MARSILPPPLHRRPLVPPVPWRRALRRARRSLALRWSLVAVAAALVALEAAGLGADAAAERDAWGSSTAVVVVLDAVARGEAVDGDDVAIEQRPLAVVPDGAVSAMPVGRVATADLVPGEVVVGSRLAPEGVVGVAALVPEGWRAVALPTSASGLGTPTPPLAVGDRVDVLAPRLVAADAVVVAVEDQAVTVAVPADDAPAVAEAVAGAVVTIALRGPSS